MALNLPQNFENDIQGRNTSLIPIIKIGDIYISTNSMTYDGEVILPLLTSNPSLKESIDVSTRNYKISNISITVNNYPYENKRFSERVEGSLINTPVEIYWISPSTTNFTGDTSALMIYQGQVRRYDMTDTSCKITVEDRSQATLHKDLPTAELGFGDDVPSKYQGKKIPFVYGHVDRSPLVISENFRKYQADSEAINFVETVETGYTNASGGAILLDSLEIDIDGEFYHVVSDSQYEYLDNYIGILPQALSGIVVGDEDTADSFEEVSLTCRKIAVPRFSITNPRHDSTLINDHFLDPSYNVDNITAITDGSLDTNNIILLGERNSERYTETVASGSNVEKLLLSINMDVTPQHDTEDGNNKIIGFKINNYNLPKFLGDKVLKVNHHDGLDGHTGDTTSVSTSYDNSYMMIWDNTCGSSTYCLHSNVIQNVFGFLTYGNGGDLVPPADYDGSTADIKLNFYDLGSPSQNGLDMPIILFSGGINNTFSIQFRTVGNYNYPVGTSYSYHRLDLTGHIDEIGLLVENKAIKVFSKDFYANVNGRAMIGDDSPTAPSAIAHILGNELGVTEIDATGTYDWKYAFTVDKKISSKRLIENIASASPYLPRFTNMGDFLMTEIPMDGGTVPEGNKIKEADCIDFSYSRSSIEAVKTRIIFKYNWDYARGEFNDSVEAEVDIMIPNYSFDYYGLKDDHTESELIIDDDRGKYIRDHITAQKFADWYLMWSCNQKLKLKIKLGLKYMFLEIGDFVDFGNELLGGVKPYGIPYTDEIGDVNFQQVFKNFLIISTNKTLEFCEIECIQMHNLDANIVYDCAGVPNGTTIVDECGVCGGDGITEGCDCDGVPDEGCDCDGNILDECGVCGGDNSSCTDECGIVNGDNSSCAGCMDSAADNFNDEATTGCLPLGYATETACCEYEYCIPFMGEFGLSSTNVEELGGSWIIELIPLGFTGYTGDLPDCNNPFTIVSIQDSTIDMVNLDTFISDEVYVKFYSNTEVSNYTGNSRRVSKVLLNLLSNDDNINILANEIELDINHNDDDDDKNWTTASGFFGNENTLELIAGDDGFEEREYIVNFVFTITTTDATTGFEITYEEIVPIIFSYHVCNIGDITGEGAFNVLDIVILANCILDENCAELENGECGDMNRDDGWNVLDITILANCILQENC